MTKDIHLEIDDDINGKLRGSRLARLIELRYEQNRDCKIIITSKSASTGLGKTTLAILLCYYADNNGWDAEEKGFIDVNDYIQAYKEVDQYSALLIDEIEHGADSRRFMTKENVSLSHSWMTLRYRNITSVATLPSADMLDTRMLKLSDLWINVVKQGVAIPHYISVNDYSGDIMRKRIKDPETGDDEIITFPELNNSDYRKMQELKDRTVRTGKEAQTYDSDDIEKAKEDAAKTKRDELIRRFYKTDVVNLSQNDIAEIMDMSQSNVGYIVNKDD